MIHLILDGTREKDPNKYEHWDKKQKVRNVRARRICMEHHGVAHGLILGLFQQFKAKKTLQNLSVRFRIDKVTVKKSTKKTKHD